MWNVLRHVFIVPISNFSIADTLVAADLYNKIIQYIDIEFHISLIMTPLRHTLNHEVVELYIGSSLAPPDLYSGGPTARALRLQSPRLHSPRLQSLRLGYSLLGSSLVPSDLG